MPDRIGEFLVASLVLLLIPGPAVLYVTARGLDQGRVAGVVSACGVELGNFALAVAAATGLSVVLESSVTAFAAVRYAGALYLVVLGVRRLIRREPLAERAVLSTSHRRLFGQGFLVGVTNPKTVLFFAAFLPQFVHRDTGSVAGQMLLLGALFTALGLVTDTSYALLSGTMGRALKRRRGFATAERVVAGCTYIGLGVLAAFTNAPHRSHAATASATR